MKGKVAFLVISCIIMILLLFTSCGQTTSKTTSTTTSSVTPTTKLTDTPTIKPTTVTSTIMSPQYGGTMVYRTKSDIVNLDPYLGSFSSAAGARLWYERIVIPDLTLDPNIFDFTGTYHPLEYDVGCLVESWESTDSQNWIWHVRQGIKWQDIPPVSGREFTAYDIEYYFHRQLGLGSGFTKPSPYNVGAENYANIQSITATDKYTIKVKMRVPDIETTRYVFGSLYDGIVAREAVEKWGNVNDWRHQIGTGPFILEDYVSGSSVTAVRNPNYWGYDKLYPKNKLPYLNEVKVLIIPDNATAYAALRTGKIDILESVDWQRSESLLNSNPELQKKAWPQNGWAVLMHIDTKPFNDIRVRKAMQMAIDISGIAKTYYGGTISSEIYGAFGVSGYYTPFDKWPQDVKDGFTYNPDGAKKLLADAGYPSGFKFTLHTSAIYDLDFYQVLKSYLSAIGINMDIQVMDNTAFNAFITADKHVAMAYQLTTNVSYPPMVWINQYDSTHNFYRGHINDPTYDQMWKEVKVIIDLDQQTKKIIQMNDYATGQFWRVTTPPFNAFVMWQPWIKGYTGVRTSTGVLSTPTRAMWLDQILKKSMGR